MSLSSYPILGAMVTSLDGTVLVTTPTLTTPSVLPPSALGSTITIHQIHTYGRQSRLINEITTLKSAYSIN